MTISSEITNPIMLKNYVGLEERFKAIYNYDYSEAIYKGSKNNICVICEEHGSFNVTPNNHLKGNKCPICTKEEKYKLQWPDIVIRFKNVHSNLYTYNNAIYRGNRVKILITCKKHGDFSQTPNAHLNGNGCPVCSGTVKEQKYLIQDLINVHGDKYIYTEVIYKSHKDKIDIICKKHGKFRQLYYSHKRGSGCPDCYNEKTNYEKYKNKMTILYYVKVDDLYKIGICLVDKRFKTTENNILKGRFKKSAIGSSIITILNYKVFNDGFDAYLKEQEILKEFDQYRYCHTSNNMNWFTGYTELFQKDIMELNKNKTIKVKEM